jgi:hypothetical protein
MALKAEVTKEYGLTGLSEHQKDLLVHALGFTLSADVAEELDRDGLDELLQFACRKLK